MEFPGDLCRAVPLPQEVAGLISFRHDWLDATSGALNCSYDCQGWELLERKLTFCATCISRPASFALRSL